MEIMEIYLYLSTPNHIITLLSLFYELQVIKQRQQSLFSKQLMYYLVGPCCLLTASVLIMNFLGLVEAGSLSSLTLSDPTINANSAYNFNIFDNNLQSYDGTIKLTFPQSLYTIGTVSCYDTNNASSTYPFNVINAYEIQITYVRGSFPSKIINISVALLKNPGSQLTLTFAYTFTAGAITSQGSLTGSFLVPGTLVSCSLSFTPSITHTETEATISMTIRNAVNSGGSITITYPATWANSASSNYPPLMYSSTSCSKISGAPLSNVMFCTISGQSVAVDGAFSSTAAASTTVSFKMTGIRSPATTSASNTVTITTEAQDGSLVDQSACSVAAVSAQTITTLTSSSQFTVGETNNLEFSWVTQSPLKVGDVISLTLPTSYMRFIQASSASAFYNTSSVITTAAAIGGSSLQYKYTITGIQSSAQIPAGMSISFGDIYIRSLLDTSSRFISILITRSGYSVASGNLAVTTVFNKLTAVSVTGDITEVSAATTLNVTFTTVNELLSASTIRIQVPNSFILTGTSPTCGVTSTNNPSAMSGSATCIFISAYVIKVSSFLHSTLPGSAVLSVIVRNALKNPLTTETTSVFIIGTYSSATDTVIDQSNNITYSASVGTIGSLTVASGSPIVGNEAIYTIQYNIIRSIKSGSSIVVTLPSEVSLSSSPSFTYSLNSGSFLQTTPTITSNNTVLTFSSIITADLTLGNSIQLKIATIRNPLSMKPSSSFTVVTKYSSFPIEQLTSGLTITNTNAATFRDLRAIVSNPMNGLSTDYDLYFQLKIALALGDTITVRIIDGSSGRNQISFNGGNSTTCRIKYGVTLISNNTCFVLGGKVTVTLGAALTDTSSSTQYQLTISPVKLARTMSLPSSSLEFTTLTSTFQISKQTILTPANTLPNSIQLLTLSILTNTSKLNQDQSFTVGITTFNGLYLLYDDFIVINIPNSYQYVGTGASGSLCTNVNLLCSIYNGDNHAIKVAKAVGYSETAILSQFSITIISGIFKSPLSFSYTTDYYLVTTFTSAGLIIDSTDLSLSTTKLTFYRTCAGYCETCLSSNTSYCQTCYQSAESGGYSYMTSNHLCVDVCGDQYYNNSGICTPCSSPCYGCVNTDSSCTSCQSGFFYDSTAATNKCVSAVQCPATTYPDTNSKTCMDCSSPCANCSTTRTTCTSCQPGLFLHNSQCSNSCLFGFYKDTINNVCGTCSTSCSGCNTNATDCIACATGYFLINSTSTQCTNNCPDGTANNTQTGICSCSSNCDRCSGSLTNCISCISSQVLYNSQCLSSCPSGTFKLNSSSTSCSLCQFSHCSECNSTHCLQCSSLYYLYSGACATSCPTGTYYIGKVCYLCKSGCKTCLNSVSCTSCFDGYLVQASDCVVSCSSGYVNFNAQQCITECPAGYYNNSGKCDLNNTDGNNTVINNTNTTTSVGKIIPFPYTISYALMICVTVGMKFIYPMTLLPSAMMSIGSLFEILSAITLLVVVSANQLSQVSATTTAATTATTTASTLLPGSIIILTALIMILITNLISLYFIHKILTPDPKFSITYRKCHCAHLIIRAISTVTYHKFHEIVFSNIFGVRAFCSKVEFVRKLFPFNVLLIISVIFSILLVTGASLLSYSVQDSLLSSPVFIQSVDCILVVVINVIPTILVLRRRPVDYEKEVAGDDEAKRYITEDQLNFQNQNGGMEEVFIQESGIRYANQSGSGQLETRKSYFYQNSKGDQNGEDTFQTPLDKKKLNSQNPISASNVFSLQNSTEALLANPNRASKISNVAINEQNDDIEQIMLEQPVKDNLANIGRPHKHDSPIGNKLNYLGYDLDPKLLALPENSEQFKKLPAEIRSKIRLAKANLQIHHNSKKVKENKMDTVDIRDIDEIQLSPKKKERKNKNKKKKNSNSKKRAEGVEGDGQDTEGQEIEDNLIETKSVKSDEQKSSIKKQKSKEKTRSIGKSNLEDLNPGKGIDIMIVDEEQNRLTRNRSEQMRKSDSKNMKHTRSQNIKKKKKQMNQQIKILHNGVNSNNEGKNVNLEQTAKNLQEFEEEQEPQLPIFKAKIRDRYGSEKDGLDVIEEKSQRKVSRDKKNKKNVSPSHKNTNESKIIFNQIPDQLPHLHSSEQINNMIVNNKELQKSKKSENAFYNDDESIYKKIYHDYETETLKSVQGDNFFGQQISPSHFNIQNQRFEDTDVSNDLPVRPMLNQYSGGEFDDGFTDEPRHLMQSGNIDYDSVISKKGNNQRIKELEKIYLPRLEVRQPRRRK